MGQQSARRNAASQGLSTTRLALVIGLREQIDVGGELAAVLRVVPEVAVPHAEGERVVDDLERRR